MATSGRTKFKKSLLLSPDENNKIQNLVGNDCDALSTSVIQLFETEPPDHDNWVKRDAGILCLVKDHSERSYFLRLYCLSRMTLVWQQEIYKHMVFHSPRPFLHIFEGQDCLYALNYASEKEAKFTLEIITRKLEKSRRKEAAAAKGEDEPGTSQEGWTSEAGPSSGEETVKADVDDGETTTTGGNVDDETTSGTSGSHRDSKDSSAKSDGGAEVVTTGGDDAVGAASETPPAEQVEEGVTKEDEAAPTNGERQPDEEGGEVKDEEIKDKKVSDEVVIKDDDGSPVTSLALASPNESEPGSPPTEPEAPPPIKDPEVPKSVSQIEATEKKKPEEGKSLPASPAAVDLNDSLMGSVGAFQVKMSLEDEENSGYRGDDETSTPPSSPLSQDAQKAEVPQTPSKSAFVEEARHSKGEDITTILEKAKKDRVEREEKDKEKETEEQGAQGGPSEQVEKSG